jgi:hypothetical protein
VDVLHDGFDFEETWEEKRLTFHRQQMTDALAEVKRIELEEQKAWLTTAMRRAIAAGLLIDETERRLALQDSMDRADAWFAETAEREKKQNAAVLEHFQSQLDNFQLEKMKTRAAKAADDIRRSNARLERLALAKRGVVRGRR